MLRKLSQIPAVAAAVAPLIARGYGEGASSGVFNDDIDGDSGDGELRLLGFAAALLTVTLCARVSVPQPQSRSQLQIHDSQSSTRGQPLPSLSFPVTWVPDPASTTAASKGALTRSNGALSLRLVGTLRVPAAVCAMWHSTAVASAARARLYSLQTQKTQSQSVTASSSSAPNPTQAASAPAVLAATPAAPAAAAPSAAAVAATQKLPAFLARPDRATNAVTAVAPGPSLQQQQQQQRARAPAAAASSHSAIDGATAATGRTDAFVPMTVRIIPRFCQCGSSDSNASASACGIECRLLRTLLLSNSNTRTGRTSSAAVCRSNKRSASVINIETTGDDNTTETGMATADANAPQSDATNSGATDGNAAYHVSRRARMTDSADTSEDVQLDSAIVTSETSMNGKSTHKLAQGQKEQEQALSSTIVYLYLRA
mgnify:FL=1